MAHSAVMHANLQAIPTHTLIVLQHLRALQWFGHIQTANSPLLPPLLTTTWLLSAAGGRVNGQNIYITMQLQMGLRGHRRILCLLLVSACLSVKPRCLNTASQGEGPSVVNSASVRCECNWRRSA